MGRHILCALLIAMFLFTAADGSGSKRRRLTKPPKRKPTKPSGSARKPRCWCKSPTIHVVTKCPGVNGQPCDKNHWCDKRTHCVHHKSADPLCNHCKVVKLGG